MSYRKRRRKLIRHDRGLDGSVAKGAGLDPGKRRGLRRYAVCTTIGGSSSVEIRFQTNDPHAARARRRILASIPLVHAFIWDNDTSTQVDL